MSKTIEERKAFVLKCEIEAIPPWCTSVRTEDGPATIGKKSPKIYTCDSFRDGHVIENPFIWLHSFITKQYEHAYRSPTKGKHIGGSISVEPTKGNILIPIASIQDLIGRPKRETENIIKPSGFPKDYPFSTYIERQDGNQATIYWYEHKVPLPKLEFLVISWGEATPDEIIEFLNKGKHPRHGIGHRVRAGYGRFKLKRWAIKEAEPPPKRVSWW